MRDRLKEGALVASGVMLLSLKWLGVIALLALPIYLLYKIFSWIFFD